MDITPIQFTAYSAAGDKVIFSVYKGSTTMSIFSSSQAGRGTGKIILSTSLNPIALHMLTDHLKAINTASPGTKMCIVIAEKLREENNKRVIKYFIRIGKDEKLINYIEVEGRGLDVMRFNLVASDLISSGSDSMSMPERSNNRVTELLTWIVSFAPIMQILTNEKRGGPSGGNNGGRQNSSWGSSGGYGRQNQSASSPAAPAPGVMSNEPDEEVPF